MESYTNDPDPHGAFVRGSFRLERAALREEVCAPWKDGVQKRQTRSQAS